MKYNSEAYQEGFKSGLYDTNPYEECSDEFDDYERGVTQNLKRMPSGEPNSFLTREDAEADKQVSNNKIERSERTNNQYRKKRDGY